MDTTATALPSIPLTVLDRLVREYQQWPVRSNRASLLGHPCLRYLTYKRVAWQEEATPPATLLQIFEEGKLHEDAVLAVMRRAGFRVTLQQKAFEYREHELTGSIDGQVLLGAESLPFDVKSCSSYTWQSLNTVDDVRNHKYHYVRGWYSQLVLYCLMGNKERSLMILKDKSTGQLKQIEIPLDFQHAEELLKKADAINAHVKAGTLPDRIPYDEDVCGRCTMFHLCLPDEALRAGATLIDDADLQAKLERRAALEQAAREFERLDKAIKDQVELQLSPDTECVVGVDWIVRSKTQTRKGYTVSASTYQTVQIQRLGKATDAA